MNAQKLQEVCAIIEMVAGKGFLDEIIQAIYSEYPIFYVGVSMLEYVKDLLLKGVIKTDILKAIKNHIPLKTLYNIDYEEGQIDQMVSEKILSFIKLFEGGKQIFLEGLCYWFSHILLSRFKAGYIAYDPIRGHFYWVYLSRAYDVEGEHDIPPNTKSISYILINDSSLYERLMKECVRKDDR